jgi:glutathione peroxidase
MKYIISLLVITALLSFSLVDDVYSLPLKNIDGATVDLSQYKNKKILFIILSLSSSDTTVTAKELSQLLTKYPSSLQVIGVPAVETGFHSGDESRIKALYMNMGSNFTLAEGMKVKKGTDQQSVFQWLTNRDKNHHFEQDVQGVGSKFFVDESGELYAVIGSHLKLSNTLIDRIVTMKKHQ